MSHLMRVMKTLLRERSRHKRAGKRKNFMRKGRIQPRRSLKRTFKVCTHIYSYLFLASKIGRYGSGGKVYTGGDDESYNSIGGGSSPSYNDSYGGNTDRYPNQRQGVNPQQNFRQGPGQKF